MKIEWIQRAAAPGLLALALALACGSGMSEPARVESGAAVLEARVAPASLRVGPNEMQIELRDAAGEPIDDAHVAVKVHMHAMGAMPAMGGAAGVEPEGNGRYRAAFDLEMGGTWLVEIEAHPPGGGALRAEGSLTVGTPGVRLASAGGSAAPAGESDAGPRAAGSGAGGHAHAAAEPGDTPAGPARHPGEFRFDEARLRQVGVRSEPARREALSRPLRASGRVTWDETALRDVTLRIGGFAGAVPASATGQRVERGQVLFELYSPELYTAQQEYLQALRSRRAARGTTAPSRADALVRAAERRLRLWELDPGEIARLAARGTPAEYVPIRAPISGYVVEKDIVAGGALMMGQRLYRIAPLDRVWIEAEVYESELADVRVGQRAEVGLPYQPGERYAARVAYVYPALEGERRTGRVRLELANPEGELRPDMYANVFLQRETGEVLTVADSAVLHAGDRAFVFLDLGEGRLRPQEVEVGRSSDGRTEIRSGLEAGQPVVVSGTFLVAGESRLRAALGSW